MAGTHTHAGVLPRPTDRAQLLELPDGRRLAHEHVTPTELRAFLEGCARAVYKGRVATPARVEWYAADGRHVWLVDQESAEDGASAAALLTASRTAIHAATLTLACGCTTIAEAYGTS